MMTKNELDATLSKIELYARAQAATFLQHPECLVDSETFPGSKIIDVKPLQDVLKQAESGGHNHVVFEPAGGLAEAAARVTTREKFELYSPTEPSAVLLTRKEKDWVIG